MKYINDKRSYDELREYGEAANEAQRLLDDVVAAMSSAYPDSSYSFIAEDAALAVAQLVGTVQRLERIINDLTVVGGHKAATTEVATSKLQREMDATFKL